MPGAVSPSLSTVSASPSSVPANGSALSTITVTLRDGAGVVVPGKTVALNANVGSSIITPATAVTNGSGVATFAVTDAVSQVVTYNAVDTTDGIAVTATATVTFSPVGPQPAFGFYTGVDNPASIETLEARLNRHASYVLDFEAWNSPNAAGVPNKPVGAFTDMVEGTGRIPIITWEPWFESLDNIISGTYDAYIDSWADVLKTKGTVYLRPMPEMNAAWYPWGATGSNTPTKFINAFRHLHDRFVARSATNVKWIWCPYVELTGVATFTAYYPGDAYVDVLGLDGYNAGLVNEILQEDGSPILLESGGKLLTEVGGIWQTFDTIFSTSYAHITAINALKPVWVCETASAGEDGGEPYAGAKAQWIRDMWSILPLSYPRVQTLIWFSALRQHDFRADQTPATSAAFSTGATATPAAGTTKVDCADYEVFVLPRGGQTPPTSAGGVTSAIAHVPWISLDWERRIDDTSQANVTARTSVECCRDLAKVRPWEHELAFYRNKQLVWVGPIVIPTFGAETVTFSARDLSAWWDHRRIHNDHSYAVATDLSIIFQDLATDAMAVDNSPGLVVITTPCGVTGVRNYLAADNMVAGQPIRDVSNIGVDWTVVARNVLAGGLVVPTVPLGVFVDEHFEQVPEVQIDGTSQGNSWTVRGAGGGAAGDAIVGGPATDPGAGLRDGVLESVDTDSSLLDKASAQASAESHLALSTSAAIIQGGQLTQDAPFPINSLIPGALCPVVIAHACVPVAGIYRMQRLSVKAAGTISAVEENVAVEFQPVGSTS